ncbi:MAG TPA: hypothetical protein VMT46_07750 [Anaerolineaceae bacterium]|nr:hypothetical protein [Anaerolineaceae bacterium]
MRIVTNEALIQRNKRIGQIATFSSLAILAAGLILSFSSPNNPNRIILSYVALIVGFIVSQVGIYFGNRWGRSPRPDELLTQGLKGLDDRYTLYHYTTPASHLLLGPPGIWVLLPYRQGGVISYENGRYRQKGGNWYLKIFGQEGLGRPDVDATNQVQDVKKLLEKELPEGNALDVNALLVFTNEKVELNLEDAPIPGMTLKKIKDTIRKKGKDAALTQEQVKVIAGAFGDEGD